MTHLERLKKTALVLLCGLFVAAAGLAEDEAKELTEQQKRLTELIAQSKAATDSGKVSGAAVEDPARPEALPGRNVSEETQMQYEQSLRDYYVYRSIGLEHRQAVFRWQLFSAKLIFIVVLILVFSGIVFAGIQFWSGLKNVAAGKTEHANPNTELELSTSGVKVSSPVLGIVILTISLAFFYLYLVYVYPIEDVF